MSACACQISTSIAHHLHQDPLPSKYAPAPETAPSRVDMTAAPTRAGMTAAPTRIDLTAAAAVQQVEADDVKLKKQAAAEREYEKVLSFFL